MGQLVFKPLAITPEIIRFYQKLYSQLLKEQKVWKTTFREPTRIKAALFTSGEKEKNHYFLILQDRNTIIGHVRITEVNQQAKAGRLGYALLPPLYSQEKIISKIIDFAISLARVQLKLKILTLETREKDSILQKDPLWPILFGRGFVLSPDLHHFWKDLTQN